MVSRGAGREAGGRVWGEVKVSVSGAGTWAAICAGRMHPVEDPTEAQRRETT